MGISQAPSPATRWKCAHVLAALCARHEPFAKATSTHELDGLQGKSVPRLRMSGYTHDRLFGFLAFSAGTDTLETGCTRREAEQAKAALSDLHSCSILHGDVDLRNFVRAGVSDGQSEGGVWVIDFGESKYVPDLRQDERDEELAKLTRVLTSAGVC